MVKPWAKSIARCMERLTVLQFIFLWNYQQTLLTSKMRVSLLEPQTIPRLEVMSGKILETLMSMVKNALKDEIGISSMPLWLDSKTALWWIANNGEWKQFVHHQVNKTLKVTNKQE